MTVSLDTTGKASFDDIYERPDPRDYYRRMSELDYRIPELAKPTFQKLIEDWRTDTGAAPTVLDIGCSYGVIAALLRLDTTVEYLSEHYRDGDTATHIARDRELLATRDLLPDVRFIGMDIAAPALEYATAAGLLHDYVHADLESGEATPAQRELLASADLVVSTGCVGYVTERTLLQVARASGQRLPRMAHFVLRMFSFEPMARQLADLGYRIERVPGTFPQRRFASEAERDQVLKSLHAKGIDPTGCEADGWLHAELFLCVPDEPARA
ncbi:class I SAM-dependent methyltransferase [Nocardia stercoris]|uniref:Class I SAM-dependent methyltransferase n=1 Tax=Nocardia stercoris TaxID=2483361 RepID=A0A3M2L6X6_9NOCA|nr:class I SAM-dependent methyltransferase [Nocardia stercoris]RMI32293.1 class I SAM-dependent methyltransferase [Nocardia stercoris]